MIFQIYSDRKVLASALHFQLGAVDFTVFQDSAQQVPAGLSLAIDVRVVGAVVTQPFKQPLQNGNISLAFVVPGVNSINGSIENMQPAMVDGTTADVSWTNATAVSFAVVATATPPLDIVSLLPGGVALKGLLALAVKGFGGKISIDIAHTTIVAPLHSATG
jgi:hypothetical protein